MKPIQYSYAQKVPPSAIPIVRSSSVSTAGLYDVLPGRVLTITSAWIIGITTAPVLNTIYLNLVNAYADGLPRQFILCNYPASTGVLLQKSISCCIQLGPSSITNSIDLVATDDGSISFMGGLVGWETAATA